MFILDYNFWSRNVKMSIKGSKESDSSLVSNENFSKILWPSGWALAQATWTKMAQNYFTYDVTHKKSATPNQKFFFECRLEDDSWCHWALEQLSSACGGGARILVRQPKTAGIWLKSGYDIFVDQLSKFKWNEAYNFSISFHLNKQLTLHKTQSNSRIF